MNEARDTARQAVVLVSAIVAVVGAFIGSGAAGGTPIQAAAGGVGQNSSIVRLENTSKNKFWETLTSNVKDMLRETDKLLPEGSSETFTQSRSQGVSATNRPQTATQRRASAQTGQSGQTTTTGPGIAEQAAAQEGTSQTLTFREAASVIVNPETGTLAIRAAWAREQPGVAWVAGGWKPVANGAPLPACARVFTNLRFAI